MPTAEQAPDADHRARAVRGVRHAPLAWWAFVAYLAVAFVAILAYFGDGWWFYLDEWDYLADRNLTDPGDLLRPHNEHLTTLPIIVYRLLFRTFGLDSYLPYQAVTVATHLTAALLLRTVMRRAGATPWIATATAATLVLFGPGYENITWAFQMGFVGALTLGLAHLLLADHDGPLDHRDHAGVICGGLAVACVSGVGIVMVAIVGLATLLRRGWRPAAFHTLPLAAIYLLWWIGQRPTTSFGTDDAAATTVVREVLSWDQRGLGRAATELGSTPLAGLALVGLLIGGTALAIRHRSPGERRRDLAAPAALLVGAVGFLTLTGVGRWPMGEAAAAASRYTYVVVALSLPMLAVAATAVADRWPAGEPVLVVVLLAVAAGNLAEFRDGYELRRQIAGATQESVVALAESPLAAEVPPSVEPNPLTQSGMTIGWLLERADDDDLPSTPEPGLLTVAVIPVQLGVSQTDDRPPGDCAPLTRPVDLATSEGDAFGIRDGAVSIVRLVNGQPSGIPLNYSPAHGQRLTVVLPDLDLRIAALPGASDAPQLCR